MKPTTQYQFSIGYWANRAALILVSIDGALVDALAIVDASV